MKTNWTTWNRLLFALLLLLALRHDCLCKAMSGAETVKGSEHSCCDMASDQAGASASNLSSHVLQKKTVCCCSERLIFNKPERKVYSSNAEPTFAQSELVAYVPSLEAPDAQIRNAELQNDFLKPSKIYLLNRSILD